MNNVPNYTLLEEKKMEEMSGVGLHFRHNKTGAKVFIISNDDNNKTFSISFRTPPTDSTGLPHILEHSVLCGSKKFPVKDPFIELYKGSLNTFLNAMTFSDKTMYPIASCNDQDFTNLMNVYMDAVFYPNIHIEDKILKQEGWHYELVSAEDDITYKGVVYNEMKGAFSSPDQVLFRKIQQHLFPDTIYRNESGGDPDYITELTNEDFIAFHHKYYHPSNSYIFLYGDFDVAEKMKWLDDNYLKDFDACDVDSVIGFQAPFKELREATEIYPISSTEDKKEKTYLSLNFVTKSVAHQVDYVGLEILEYVLLEAPGAPLKKALIDANLGKDVFGNFDSSILQPTFSIVVKNAEEDRKDEFLQIIQSTLQKIATEGLDKNKLKAALNRFEFKVKEADFGRYPKGVIYAINAMDAWLYDQSPFLHFSYNAIFDELKKITEEGYFDQLIRNNLLNNSHAVLLVLKPDSEVLSKKELEIKARLKDYKESLNSEEIQDLVRQTAELETYQNEPESEEHIQCIPLLELEDIPKEVEWLDVEKTVINGIQLIRHQTFTNNITYLQLAFDAMKVPMELVPYTSLLTQILGKMNTKKYGFSELSDEINLHTGGIRCGMNIYGINGDQDSFKPCLEISMKCFNHKLIKLFEIIKEILMGTIFTDKKRLKEIILESKSRLESSLSDDGNSTAAKRAESYFSKSSLYNEYTSGIDFYRFLEGCADNFDANADKIINDLSNLTQILFRTDHLLVGQTSEEPAFEIVAHELASFSEALFKDSIKREDICLTPIKKNEGFMTSSKIQYVAQAGNFVQEKYSYTGEVRVLQTILGLDYLWSQVRVKGGAYGCWVSFHRDGNVCFVSYRDPNLKETLGVYEKVVDYIDTFEADEREIRKYIIGTISKLDQPLTPSMKNQRILALDGAKLSVMELQKERDEVLSTTPDKIRFLGAMVRSVLKQQNICVIGNENKVQDVKDLFMSVENLLK